MYELQNKKLTSISKVLRKNMTKEECPLWYDFLKKLPVNVNRQKVLGNYIVDFYCPSVKLIIELDGSQHYTSEHENKDNERDKFLASQGFDVVRFTNLDINTRFNDICQELYFRIMGEADLEKRSDRLKI